MTEQPIVDLTLEIIGVRVLRVQERTPEDIIKEGIIARSEGIDDDDRANRKEFRRLWDFKNGKPEKITTPTHKPLTILGGPYCWAKNPWIWRISFKRLQP